jgi:hypothetical protein
MAAAPPLSVPDAVQYLPDNTAYTVLLDMRDTTWRQLDQYALFQQLQAQTGQPIGPDSLPFLPTDLDYQTEIAPWISNTTAYALLPLEQPQVTTMAEHEILIAPIVQPAAFSTFIDRITDLRGTEPTTQRYQTLDILYWKPQFIEPDDEIPEDAPTNTSRDAAPQLPSPEIVTATLTRLPSQFPPLTAAELRKTLSSDDSGIDIVEAPIPEVPGLAIARLPNALIVAETPAALRAWVEVRPNSAADSLAANERFWRTLAHPQYEPALATAYGSLAEMIKYSASDFSLPDLPFDLPLSIPDDISPRDIAQFASLQLDSSLEVVIYPTAQGIRVQGRGYYDDTVLQTLPTLTEPASPVVLNYIPGNSYVMVSGQNLALAWENISAGLEANETTQSFLEQARTMFTAFTGLDLDADVFGWMDQGFSAFLFPTAETPLTTILPDLHIGLGIALQTRDRDRATATFRTLDETLGSTFLTLDTQTVDSTSITGWGFPLEDGTASVSFLGRGWVSDDTLLLSTSLGSLTELLGLEPLQTLPNTFRFVQSTRSFPQPNQGYLYANTAPMRDLINRFIPPDPEDPTDLEWRQLLASIQVVSGTLSFNDTALQLDGLMMLAPAAERSPTATVPVAPVEQ